MAEFTPKTPISNRWEESEALENSLERAQHPSPEEIEDDEPKERHIPPTRPDLPSGR